MKLLAILARIEDNYFGMKKLVLVTLGFLSVASFSRDTLWLSRDMKKCSNAFECVKVDPTCNHCCGLEAIAKEKLDEYQGLYAERCKNFSGPTCRCTPVKYHVDCVSNQCNIVLGGR